MMQKNNLTFYFNWEFTATFLYITVPAHFTAEYPQQIAQLFKQQCNIEKYSPSTWL